MRVLVVYALPDHQEIRSVELDSMATLGQALESSGLLTDFALDLTGWAVGVAGRVRSLTTPLQEGDRVEIYRPRLVDPKAQRRERLKK